MNEHDDLDGVGDELSPAMRGRRKALASLIGGFAVPLLPHVPWAPGSGVVATHPPQHVAHDARCGNEALVFPITDPASVIKAAMAVGIEAIPVVGGILGAIFALIWPENGTSIWDQIKDNVTKLVHGAVEDEMLRRLNSDLNGMKAVAGDHLDRIEEYLALPSEYAHSRLLTSIDATHKKFKDKAELFKNDKSLSLKARCQMLPLYVQLANLHLVFLRDAAVNASAYGFDEHGAAIFLNDLHKSLRAHQDYVDTTLPALFDALRAEYEAKRGNVEFSTGSGMIEDGFLATGAWESKKNENNTRSLLIAFVDDYRKLWPHLLPGAAPAAPLTRELWFGPYGVPDCREIGVLPRNVRRVGADYVADPKPDVVMPASNAGHAIRHVGVPQINVRKRAKWRFPRNFEVYREGDGLPVLPNTWGFSLAPHEGGPVVGMRVDTAFYRSRGSRLVTLGHLVSAVHFKQDNKQVRSIGSSDFTGQEIKSHSGEDVPVPDGHILHEIHQCTTVRELYKEIGDASAESVGSVMFSFKLADPELHATNRELLRRVFIASPVKLSVDDLVDMELRLERANSTMALPSKRAGLRSRLEHEMDVEHLIGDREAFWQYVREIASD